MKFGFKKKLIPKWYVIVFTGLILLMGGLLVVVASLHLNYYGLSLANVYVGSYGVFLLVYAVVLTLVFEVHNIKIQGGFK